VGTDELAGNLDATVAAMSEPMVSHDVVAFYLLSREVNRHITVVQSGQGADEVFTGYHWYPPMVGASPVDASARYAAAVDAVLRSDAEIELVDDPVKRVDNTTRKGHL
jgi:asparagine synthase (glutamine-hydrolysing)